LLEGREQFRPARAPAFSGGENIDVLETALVFIQLCGEKLLALTLFVARVIADDHDSTVATNNLALVADLLDAWVYLHVSYSLFIEFLVELFTCSDK
jgi:hypothetical protein